MTDKACFKLWITLNTYVCIWWWCQGFFWKTCPISSLCILFIYLIIYSFSCWPPQSHPPHFHCSKQTWNNKTIITSNKWNQSFNGWCFRHYFHRSYKLIETECAAYHATKQWLQSRTKFKVICTACNVVLSNFDHHRPLPQNRRSRRCSQNHFENDSMIKWVK
jgi:hypothetical protein